MLQFIQYIILKPRKWRMSHMKLYKILFRHFKMFKRPYIWSIEKALYVFIFTLTNPTGLYPFSLMKLIFV